MDWTKAVAPSLAFSRGGSESMPCPMGGADDRVFRPGSWGDSCCGMIFGDHRLGQSSPVWLSIDAKATSCARHVGFVGYALAPWASS